jgi:hypothetical protein
MPEYLAIPLAVLISVIAALMLVGIGAATTGFLLGKFKRSDDFDNAITAFFFAAPSIAVLAFVFCFSIVTNWHHATSWRAPTFAFTLGSILLWSWAHDWIGFAWYVPGIIGWLVSCWFLHRKSISHSEHIIQA